MSAVNNNRRSVNERKWSSTILCQDSSSILNNLTLTTSSISPLDIDFHFPQINFISNSHNSSLFEKPNCLSHSRLTAMRTSASRVAQRAVFNASQKRAYSNPRHLLSISNLAPKEFATLVKNAAARKQAVKSGQIPASMSAGLANQTVAMMFSKRSTRTRVSTEAAVTLLGGHPMFLGSNDIQLGVSFAIVIFSIDSETDSCRSMSHYTTLRWSSHP